MIEDEIYTILHSGDDEGVSLNKLADEFRRGRDHHDILRMLEYPSENIIRVGVWITNEIDVTHYNYLPIISQLWSLTKHRDAGIRFLALGSLFPFLDARDARSLQLISELKDDANEGVRVRANAAAKALLNNM